MVQRKGYNPGFQPGAYPGAGDMGGVNSITPQGPPPLQGGSEDTLFSDRTGQPGADDREPADKAGMVGRGMETSRERGMGGGSNVAPRQPAEPTPMAGATMQAPSPQMFEPMGRESNVRLTSSMGGGLYGKSGGLQGGGLGVPFDPTSNAQSDPISTLLQLLMRSGKV